MLEHRTTRAAGGASGKASAAEPVERSLATAATHRASGRFDTARRNLDLALEGALGRARLTGEGADAFRAMGRCWVDASRAA